MSGIPKLSYSRRVALKNIESPIYGGQQHPGWTRTIYTHHNDLLVKAGLLERANLEYIPPPRVQAHYRLTPLGRAVLSRNEPDK